MNTSRSGEIDVNALTTASAIGLSFWLYEMKTPVLDMIIPLSCNLIGSRGRAIIGPGHRRGKSSIIMEVLPAIQPDRACRADGEADKELSGSQESRCNAAHQREACLPSMKL